MLEVDKAFSLLGTKLHSWLRQAIMLLPNVLIGAVVLVITFFVARLVRRLIADVLRRVSHSEAINDLVSAVAYLVTLLLGVFFVLGILNLDKTVTSLLAGVGIIGLALGFAFQDIAANFIAGIIIAIQRPFNVGDMVQTTTFFGVVERISLRTVEIRQVTGELVRVPNKSVFENALINFSANRFRRVDVDGGVRHDSDLEHVRQVALETIAQLPNLAPDKPVQLMFTAFTNDAVTFQLRFWILHSKQIEYVGAKSDAIIALKRAFDEADISLAGPDSSSTAASKEKKTAQQ
ncbi:mechanosensitive ion channel family protein [Hymenobacter sp. DG25A]|uniref:mechanosensitive ion channel family protein n=1 Tax=Hymenobacter sp. DG25A TaxID=1385663 RepID=UPI0006BCBE01|nr:mechanosensitive ion channel protein MscS [Hymenobacter sp. DG25A]